MDRVPPHDVKAEQAVLGSCMIAPKAYPGVRRIISNDDWYRPAHEAVWAAIVALAEAGNPFDAVAVAAQLNATKSAQRAGGVLYLHELITSVATAANAEYHAELIAAHAVRRKAIEIGTRMAQRAYNDDDKLEDILAYTEAELQVLTGMRRGDGPVPGLMTWGEFIARYSGRSENWIVPGLIGRKDVWMILAPPGAGKTTLSRQLCWAIAAGRHPFKLGEHVPPERTLLIDLENDEGMAADESVEWYGRIDSLGQGVDDRGWIYSRPQGLNVRDATDANLLDQVIGDTKPAFVALGSLYKSFTRSGDWDQAAGEARVVFDRLRARHSVAFWLEHHMPKATDGGRKHTPFGSSVWEWWASHGRVLERAGDKQGAPYRFAASFRGDRRKVECPVGFTRGGRIPWEPIWDESELDVLIEASE